jgi:hypothetical protein
MMAILKLKEEAKLRRLPITNSMGLDQVANLLKAHDAGELSIASKPGPTIVPPSPAHLGSLSRASAYQSETANGYLNSLSTGIPPSQFYPPTPPYNQKYSQSANLPHQTVPKYVHYGTPSALKTDGGQAISIADQEVRPNSTDSVKLDTGGRMHSRKYTANCSSRYQSNPQGLNGGPPGGGTIINGLESKKRQPSKSSDAGSANDTRSSTPATGERTSATPQPRIQTPPIPNFKRGGIVLSFGTKATRVATAQT